VTTTTFPLLLYKNNGQKRKRRRERIKTHVIIGGRVVPNVLKKGVI